MYLRSSVEVKLWSEFHVPPRAGVESVWIEHNGHVGYLRSSKRGRSKLTKVTYLEAVPQAVSKASPICRASLNGLRLVKKK